MRRVSVEQAYSVVQSMYAQATGENIAVTDPSSYVTVAAPLAKLPFNQVYPALLEALSSIRFSIRPYKGKFHLAWNDEDTFGSYRLKISKVEQKLTEDNPAWKIATGQTFGTHTVQLSLPYQAAYWGSNTFQAKITIAEKPLRKSLPSAGAMASFLSMQMQDLDNQLQEYQEAQSRLCALNFIAGKYYYGMVAKKPGHVYHMVSEYNKAFKKTHKTVEDIRSNPLEYTAFIKFVYKFLDERVAFLGNRDKESHINPISDPKAKTDGGTGIIMRHTDPADARAFVLREYIKDIDTQVMTDIRNREYLKPIIGEEVLYWQALKEPTKVSVTPLTFEENGTTKAQSAQTFDKLFCVVYDKDALGCGMIREQTSDTPIDAEKHCYNHYVQQESQWWNDFTEKGFIVLMDCAPEV